MSTDTQQSQDETKTIVLRDVETQVAIPESLTPEEVGKQMEAIRTLMKSQMSKDVHYGVIPGTKKPTLLQPGAQMLGKLFMLSITFDVTEKEMKGDHREYRVTAHVTNSHGRILGMGVGVCSSMESRYRFRKEDNLTITDKPLPKEYWNAKEDWKKQKGILERAMGKPGDYKGKKGDDGKWYIAEKIGEPKIIEHPNPTDNHNTCLKIGKKRALVDAILNVTAATEIFTQDMEDVTANAAVHSTTSYQQEEAPTDLEIGQQKEPQHAPDTWEGVVVHVGFYKDRQLGTLPVVGIQKLVTAWMPSINPEKASTQDLALMKALNQAKNDLEASWPTEPPPVQEKPRESAPEAQETASELDPIDATTLENTKNGIAQKCLDAKLPQKALFATLKTLNFPGMKDWTTVEQIDDLEFAKLLYRDFDAAALVAKSVKKGAK